MAERLNFGCGPVTPAGWVNFDRDNHGQEHRGDILAGLPFADGTFECVAAHHVLQMLSWPELVPALAELHRVTAPGGWLRISVPDVLSAVYAYEVGDADHFQIDDTHEKTIDGNSVSTCRRPDQPARYSPSDGSRNSASGPAGSHPARSGSASPPALRRKS